MDNSKSKRNKKRSRISNIKIKPNSNNVEKNDKKRKSKKFNFIIIIRIILILIILIALIRIIVWKVQTNNDKNIMDNLKDEVLNITDSDIDEINFEILKSINNDFVGWIRVGDTNIDYPIVQGDDNNYYLKHNIYNDYSHSGSIFMDCRNNNDFSDSNTVIYGHNMRNDTMFSEIKNIYEGNTDNNIVTIYLEDENLNYKIFSTRIIDPDKDITIHFKENELNNYIASSINDSKINFNVNVPNDTKIISLITCSYTNTQRMIVQGYLLEN